MILTAKSRWYFTRAEKLWLAVALIVFLSLGGVLERRTALRHAPMTDLGVFCIASGAVWSGLNPYNIPDWHGWHYQYPPALAIAFFPFAEPVPLKPPPPPPGKKRPAIGTPWGYQVEGSTYYGLHRDNLHFFLTVAAWYVLSLLGIVFSTHLLACTLEQKNWREPLPVESPERRHWWLRRLVPVLVCGASLGTDLSRGQADVLMLTAIAAGIYSASRHKGFRAGLYFAVPATIKMFPPLLIAYPILRRQWRMAFGVAAGLLILLFALPTATLGIQRTKELYQCWYEVLAKPALGEGTDTSRLNELTGLGSTDNQSILTVLHNWNYFDVKPEWRPVVASSAERDLATAIGVVLALAATCVIGFRRRDSPHELLAVTGVLIALGLLIDPVVHNFYYLMMLPLVSALFDFGLLQNEKKAPIWIFLAPVFCFFVTDAIARIPVIGHQLRELGFATASLIWLTVAGVIFLARQKKLRSVAS